MKRMFFAPAILLIAAGCVAMASAADTLDLQKGVPEDVFLVVKGMHNPERDYQKKYYEEVWKTVQETEIIERALAILTKQMGEEDLAQATSVIEELREAVDEVDIDGLSNCKEAVYAQQMVMWQPEGAPATFPTSQHLGLIKVKPEVAKSTVDGVKNLFALAEKYSDGNVVVSESEASGATLYTLTLPPQSPIQPTIGQLDNVLVLSSSRDLAAQSLELMTDGTGKSKFDDPRLAEALQKLPKPEDSLTFFDGTAMFETLSTIAPTIEQLAPGDENVQRVVKFIAMIMEEVSIFEYEVMVEYTEGNLNRTATYGKLTADSGDSTICKMLASGEKFDKWQSWVPAGSLGYSLGTGANMHILYERIMEVLENDVPEAAPGLAQFDAIQQQLDLYLDRDILQAFSGEYATITVVNDADKPEQVIALRCHKPDRIKELIDRGVAKLLEIPQVQAQQLKLVESQELDGFVNVSAAILPFIGMNPVIGFQDGWMYIGQSSSAVQKVLDAKAGNGETVETTDDFKRLNIEIDGPVDMIKYANTAENTRAVADALRKAGFFFQMAVGMSGANADDKSLEPVKEILALLPDVAKIVDKFDFLEAKITVVQDGDDANSYTKRSVVVVRAPEEDGNG